jgi:hypothetical protein
MKNYKTDVKMSLNGRFVIVTVNGEVGLINANLLRYHLGVPYTKKNGVHVSTETIAEIKQKSQAAYVEKLQSRKPESA